MHIHSATTSAAESRHVITGHVRYRERRRTGIEGNEGSDTLYKFTKRRTYSDL